MSTGQKKSKGKLQAQVKNLLKRKNSSSSEENDPILVDKKPSKRVLQVQIKNSRKISSSSEENVPISVEKKPSKRVLQMEMKNSRKRKLSSSSEEDVPEYSLKKIREMEKELEQFRNAKKLLEEEKENEQIQSIIDTTASTDQQHQKDDDDNQLYGRDYDEKMILIGNDIYCRKVIYDMALGSSHKATQVARQMMEGVFKKGVLLRATVTGQSPRAQGPERQKEPVLALDIQARNAIIDFAINVGKEKKWEIQNIRDIKRSMSQRLGELKREAKKKSNIVCTICLNHVTVCNCIIPKIL